MRCASSTALEERLPVGAAVLVAPGYWQGNPVIPGFFEEYFALSAALGDEAHFGEHLDRKPQFDSEAVLGLLDKVQHPFAAKLKAELTSWTGRRIDRDFLRTVGTLWDPKDRDPLLVAPLAWKEGLAAGAAAIREPRPRSVLVTGDPRTGKSSFVKLLGQALEDDGWTLFSASGNELMADQMYIGQLEGRVRKLVDALNARRKLVWHVRDLAQLAHSGTHQGQSASLLEQILPAVTAGELVIIAESSHAAATRLFQTRPSLRSVMLPLQIEPMDEAETLALAKAVGARIAEHAGIAVSDDAVDATLRLVQHYLGSRQLPGAVLELLKRAAARTSEAQGAALTAENVIDALSQISGLPKLVLDTRQRLGLAEVRGFFASRVMGQPEAVDGGRRPHRHAEGRADRSATADRRLPLRGPDRHRQDRARQDARRVPVRLGRAHDPARHERVPDGRGDRQDPRPARRRDGRFRSSTASASSPSRSCSSTSSRRRIRIAGTSSCRSSTMAG